MMSSKDIPRDARVARGATASTSAAVTNIASSVRTNQIQWRRTAHAGRRSPELGGGEQPAPEADADADARDQQRGPVEEHTPKHRSVTRLETRAP